MPVSTEASALNGPLTTQLVTEYRNIEKLSVFGGSSQAVIQNSGKLLMVMLPHTEYLRLAKRSKNVRSTITATVTAGELAQRPGRLLVGVKGGTEIVGITRHSDLRAVVLPYGIWASMKKAAREAIPEPDVVSL